MKQTLSILPSRRANGPAYYEVPEPNYLQMFTTVKGEDKRYKRPVSKFYIACGVVGLVCLLYAAIQAWG